MNIASSFLLLAIAIFLLWLAVTGKLTQVLDAWDVAIGKASAQQKAATATGVSLTIPSLPQNPVTPSVSL